MRRLSAQSRSAAGDWFAERPNFSVELSRDIRALILGTLIADTVIAAG
jgi:hypothetical protein